MERKEALINGAIAGFIGFVMSMIMNYFVIPFPATVLSNAVGNGISGLISGFMGGFMGIMVYSKKLKKANAEREAATGSEADAHSDSCLQHDCQ